MSEALERKLLKELKLAQDEVSALEERIRALEDSVRQAHMQRQFAQQLVDRLSGILGQKSSAGEVSTSATRPSVEEVSRRMDAMCDVLERDTYTPSGLVEELKSLGFDLQAHQVRVLLKKGVAEGRVINHGNGRYGLVAKPVAAAGQLPAEN